MLKQIKNKDSGFSLVEIAIAMIVLGVLAAGIMQSLKATAVQSKIDQTNSATFAITDSLSKFISENVRYPCPAASNIAQSEAGYGVETDCSNTTQVAIGACGFGYCVVASPSDPNVRIRIGTIPGKTLNIDKKDTIDAQNNQFTYAVTETQATNNYVENAGAITLLDAQKVVNPSTNQMTYTPLTRSSTDIVFLSHGESQAGAITAGGAVNASPCSGTWTDIENCDGDGTFTSKAYSMSSSATGPYDDTLVSNIWSWIYIWDKTLSSDENIYNRDSGNLGVGTGLNVAPSEKLHVLEGNMRVDGKVQTTALCQDDGTNCFDPDLLGGDGMHCNPNSEFLFGIQSSNTLCRNALNNSEGGCQGVSHFMTGITASGGGLSSAECSDYFNTNNSNQTPLTIGSIYVGTPGVVPNTGTGDNTGTGTGTGTLTGTGTGTGTLTGTGTPECKLPLKFDKELELCTIDKIDERILLEGCKGGFTLDNKKC